MLPRGSLVGIGLLVLLCIYPSVHCVPIDYSSSSLAPQPSHPSIRPSDVVLADDLQLLLSQEGGEDEVLNVTQGGKTLTVAYGKDRRNHVFTLVKGMLVTRSQVYTNADRYSPWRVLGRNFAMESTGTPTLPARVSVSLLFDERLIIFARDQQNKLQFVWESKDLPCRWTNWHTVPGKLRSSPVANRRKDGALEVYGVNDAQRLVMTAQKDRAKLLEWSDWKVMSSEKFVSDELLLKTIDLTVWLMGVNDKGVLMYTTRELGDYSGWESFKAVGHHLAGLKFRDAPTMAMDNNGDIWVFAVSRDFYLCKIRYSPATKGKKEDTDASVTSKEAVWSDWEVTDHRFRFTPALQRNVDGRIVAVGVGLDNSTKVAFQVTHPEKIGDIDTGKVGAGTKGLHFSHWYSLRASEPSRPTFVRNPNGELEIFIDPNTPGQELLHAKQMDINSGFSDFHPVQLMRTASS